MNRDVRKAATILSHAYNDPEHNDMRYAIGQALILLAPPSRKRRPRDPRKAERKATVKELDALCRAVVFARDGGVCQFAWPKEEGRPDPLFKCDRSEGRMDWSHMLTKGAHPNLRHDPRNAVVMCRRHHMQWHGMVKGGAPSVEEYYVWRFGRSAWNELQARANSTGKAAAQLVRLHLEQEAKRLGVKV